MGSYRPIKTKCWESFLIYKGCHFKDNDGTSHHKWRCPNCIRSIIFRGAEKEVPFAHINSNLKSMGVPKEDFLDWVAENC
jgi:hypothetical protein